MKSIKQCAAFALLCIVMSCNQSSEQKETGSPAADIATSDREELSQQSHSIAEDEAGNRHNQDTTFQEKKKQPSKEVVQPKIDWDKKIIKTANLNAEVKNYADYYSTLREKIKSVGGYVAQEEQNQSDYKVESSIVIKVPVDQFDNAIGLISTGVKINERKVSSQDVTGEVVDVKSRMEAKKHVRDRYVDLLKQAKNMDEILNVQSEINGIQEEIESAAGRVNYLSHASVFSTIHLTFFQVLDVTVKEKQEPTVWDKLMQSLKTGWLWLVDIVISLASVWPLLILLFIVWRLVKKHTRPSPKVS